MQKMTITGGVNGPQPVSIRARRGLALWQEAEESRAEGRTLYHAVDAAEEGGLERGEAEAGDNDGALVREGVGDVVERGEEREDPGLGVGERLVELVHLEVLILDTGLVFLDGLLRVSPIRDAKDAP